MKMGRLSRVIIVLAFLGGVFYIAQNYSLLEGKISRRDLESKNVLGSWTSLSSTDVAKSSLDKIKEQRDFLLNKIGGNEGGKMFAPEAGQSGNSKETGKNDSQEVVDQLRESLAKLSQEQVAKVKERIIQEIFPDCECTCSAVKSNND